MTTRDEVKRLYDTFIQEYKEWSRKASLKERDFSSEMSNIARIFYDYDGGELGEEMETWMHNFIGELEIFTNKHGLGVGREINGKTVLLIVGITVDDTRYIADGVGHLGWLMQLDEDDDVFNQTMLSYKKKARLREMTEEDWDDIANSLKNGLNHIDSELNNKLAQVDVALDIIENRIKNEALIGCTEYMRPIMREYYHDATKLYHKLVELDPQNAYIRQLDETTFIEGFDVFYKHMIEQDQRIHGILKIIYGLKNNIALAEHYGRE